MTDVHLILRALPGRRSDLLNALEGLELRAAADDAYLVDVDVSAALDDPDVVLVVSSWPSPEHYERWQADHGWPTIVSPLRQLLASEPELHVYRLVDSIR